MSILTASIYSILIFVAMANCQSAFIDVITDQGPVRGYNVDDTQVISFYGIPYASAPTGEDRFKAPLAPPTWTTTFNASVMDITCPQGDLTVNVVNRQTITIDCLIANIWVPNSQRSNLPVYVYLHGGFFQTGNAYEMLPIELVKRGMVVVSINYRLGLHGFLCLGTAYAPGNAGLKDQLAGLRWVRNNIANFGGDRDNVTLGGSSAGSVATELHMLSSASNGLFNKIITESGSALSWTMFEANYLEKAENFARQNGFITNYNVQQLESFFRNLTENELNHPYTKNHRSFGFLPCIETHNLSGVEKFLAEHPENITREGRFVSRPNLSGFTSMEGLHFSHRYETDIPLMEENFSEYMPPNIEYDSVISNHSVAQRAYDFYFRRHSSSGIFISFIDFYTDSMFAYYQYVSARFLSTKSPVYLYLFSFNGSLINEADNYDNSTKGPGHMAQSLYVYQSTNSDIDYSAMTSADFLTQERLRDMWYNFIKYGQPIPSRTTNLNVDWTRLTINQGNYLDIGSQLSQGEGFPLFERFSFWDELYQQEFSPNSAFNFSLSLSIVVFALLLLIFEA